MSMAKSLQDRPPADPKTQAPKPEYPQKPIDPPGLDSEMTPKADHGEDSYKGLGRLKDRVALITGGDSGIGRAVAIAFAREGADVILSYLPEEESDARETCNWVEKAGRKAIRVAGDIKDERHCQALVQRAFDDRGRLDILVNNAAFQRTHEEIDEFSSEEFEATFRTNVFAMFYLCKAAIPHMGPGSSIINSCSIEAYQPMPMLLDYSSTKGAIVTFTKALAQEVVSQGIRANSVAPGPVWTPLIPATLPPQQVSQFGQAESPMGRPAQPAELAPAYVFLASQESSYVNGETLGVTGGSPLP
jgi:NAD(P)-dependent dehydrogenase (short-subunit alcohol dehydrogenase family)